MRDGRTARGFYLLDVLQAAPYGPSLLCRAAFLTWICEQLDQHPRHAGMARIGANRENGNFRTLSALSVRLRS